MTVSPPNALLPTEEVEVTRRIPLSGQAYREGVEAALGDFANEMLTRGFMTEKLTRDGDGWKLTYSFPAMRALAKPDEGDILNDRPK